MPVRCGCHVGNIHTSVSAATKRSHVPPDLPVHDRRARRRRLRPCDGIAFSVLATAAMMTLAAKSLPAASTVSLGRLRLRHGGGVRVLRRLQSRHRSRIKAVLRRFDHAAIYVKIAGTYTPFAFVKMGDAVGLALLAWCGPSPPSAPPPSCCGRNVSCARPTCSISCRAGPSCGVRLAGADHLQPSPAAARGRRLPLYRRRHLPPLGRGCPTTTPSGTRSCCPLPSVISPPSSDALGLISDVTPL
jgi:hypothetical protein